MSSRNQVVQESKEALRPKQPQINSFFHVVNPAPKERRVARTASDSKDEFLNPTKASDSWDKIFEEHEGKIRQGLRPAWKSYS